MFLPNTFGMLSHATGYTKSGETKFGEARRTQCAVIKLVQKIAKTPIRTDASASRGRADEDVSISTILFPVSSGIVLGDRFVIRGLDLRCSGVEPRLNVLGQLDHFECSFEAWSAS